MPLRQLVPLPNDKGSDSDSSWKIDIVAVHGLNPRGKATSEHATDTWTQPKGKDGYLWLRDELPKTCPQARVFLYEYNSSLVFRQTKESFVLKANDLLDALRSKRKHAPLRPLILIAHSLGGILIQQALVNAHNNPDYLPIKQATSGLMLFGTPHAGGNGSLVVIGSLVAQIATFLGFRAKSDMVSTLKNGSIFTDILQESFRHQLMSYQIVSFYEKHGDIVPISSASFGLPGDQERILGIEADHSNMCRFDPAQQTDKDNLEKVVSSLEDLYGLALAKAAKSDDSNHPEVLKAKKKILKWLYRSEQDNDYQEDLARHHATDNTCNWIFQRPEFVSWISESSSGILWVNGIPGSGKSFLAAHVVRHLQYTQSQVMFCFCNDRYEETRLLSNVLGCLVHQMLILNKNLLNIVSVFHDKSTQKRLKSLETSIQVFKDSVSAVGPCCILIDALDECTGRETLTRLLLDLIRDIPSGLKILVTSRDEGGIRRDPRDETHAKVLTIRDNDIKDDIQIVVEHLVSSSHELSLKLAEYAPLKRDVINGLVAAAQGMFLLPRFMIADLETKATVKEIYECLDDIPTDLDSYYITTLAKIDARRAAVARKIFTWVLRTKRPLSLEEMKAAMSLDGSRFLNLESDIKSSCGCLVKVDGKIVRLSHSTVKQFLLESAAFRDHPLRASYIDTNGADHVANACFQYIFMYNLRIPLFQGPRFAMLNLDDIRKIYPFLEYAAIHWVDHCRGSKSRIESLICIKNILNSPRFSVWYEAVSMFDVHEGFQSQFDKIQQWFLSLDFSTTWVVNQKVDMASSVASRISELWSFIEIWEKAMKGFPSEIYNINSTINFSCTSNGKARQQTLLTSNGEKGEDKQLYKLVDGHFINFGVDRFLLGATSIFSWNSLMQSEAWDVLPSYPITPEKPECILMNVQNILSGCVDGRQGLALAAVNRVTAHAILRKDLKAVAIVWASYNSDQTAPPRIKSYAWFIRPDTTSIMLRRIEWTDTVDPSRVDLTTSSAFNGSRAAVAFTEEGGLLWTPGGAYELDTGVKKEHPPEIFYDSQISALTFSRDASTIAGVRKSIGVEVYSMRDGKLIGNAEGEVEILGLSAFGGYCLYIRSFPNLGSSEDHRAGTEDSMSQELRILSAQKDESQILWTPTEKLTKAANDQESLTLSHFYNNGGLFAFSDNETILVVCIPSIPSWKIVAFDLQEWDIASTMWVVDCANILMGTYPICLSFCPINDRRLYMMSNMGIIRAAQISRKDTTTSSSILTTRQGDSGPVASGITMRKSGPHLIVIKFPEDTFQSIRVFSWNIKTLKKADLSFVLLPCIRCFARLEVDNLIIDLDEILGLASHSSAWRWDFIREGSMERTINNAIQRNTRSVLRHYIYRERQRQEAQLSHVDGIMQMNNVSKESSEEKVEFPGGKTEISSNGEPSDESKPISQALENDRMQLYQVGVTKEDGADGVETIANQTFHPKQNAAAERESNVEMPTAERRGSAGLQDAGGERNNTEIKQSAEQNSAAGEDDQTDASSSLSYGSALCTYSTAIRFSPTCELAFVASTIAVSGLPESTADTQNLSLVVSIIRTDTGQRKTTGPLDLVTIGAPVAECIAIEYDPVHKVLAYALSLTYHQKTRDGSYWRMGKLFICRLANPIAIADSEHEDVFLRSEEFDTESCFTSMIFSPCGRYIYGTSSWYDAVVEIADTWGIEPARTLRAPEGFHRARNLSISLWRDSIMLVGNIDAAVVAIRINPAPRASFSTAILALAPSLVENATGFRALWPTDASSEEGTISIVSRNGNQIRKKGEIGGNLGWPFVLTVKEKDIGAWSEPILEAVVSSDDFPTIYPDLTVFA